jgi:PTS system cellobiose-specific IIB component
MTRAVAIICAAGVASTFLARALRELLAQHDLDWNVEPLAADQLPARAGELSIVLVGHHLAAQFTEVRDGLAETGVPAHLLDSDDHASAARQALALLLAHDSRTTVSSPLDS